MKMNTKAKSKKKPITATTNKKTKGTIKQTNKMTTNLIQLITE